MSRPLREAGLPGDVRRALEGLVGGAGYDLDDEAELALGMTAALATLRVCDAAAGQRPARSAAVGRNDPCPCGSGRKYKKCCLRGGGVGQEPQRYGPGNPLERPELIPRINDPEALAEDLETLEGLFEDDDTLARVRFDADKLVAFVMDEPPEEDPAEDDDHDGTEKVARYLREVEGLEALGDLERALLRAARDSAATDWDVRALAAGVALLEMERAADPEPDGDAVNPLLNMLFWLSLRELATAPSEFDVALRALLPPEDPAPSPLAADPALGAALDRYLAGETFVAAGDEPDLQRRIAAGQLPAGLALPSVLPALVRLARLEPGAAGAAEVRGALAEAAAELGEEDAALLDQALGVWLERRPEATPAEEVAAVARVRLDTSGGSCGPFGEALLEAALRHCHCFRLRGEPELPTVPGGALRDRLTLPYLEACGHFLMVNGLGEMALRTWRLAELLGPVPEDLAQRIAKLEAGLVPAPPEG